MTPHNDDTRPRRAGVRQGVGVGTRQDWQRLGALMRARRGQMGYQYRNRFAAARAQQLGAGPLSTKNMIEIEEPPPKRKPGSWMTETLERIAAFYDTTAASMLRVVRGDADQLDWVARAGDTAGPGPGPMTDPERQQAAWPYASRIWQDISDYQQRHPGTSRDEIPGEALFGKGSWHAKAWDNPPPWATFRDRVWLIADSKAMQAARHPGRARENRSA